ncbi:MAG: hypothetical protein ACOZB3_05875 [Calditrichota bacterium]
MTITRNQAWGRLSVLLVLSLLIAIPVLSRTVVDKSGGHSNLDAADPDAERALIAHDIGNVRMTLANWGEMGNPDGTPGYKGFEYPINSGSDFLFSAGVWVGAIVNGQRLVTTATDGDNGTNEFWPVHIGAIPTDRLENNPDWFATSKNFDVFSGMSYIWGAKGADDDRDWTEADHLDNPNFDDGRNPAQPSSNYDGGRGLIGFDDDGDDLIDEEITNGLDDDGDGFVDEDTDITGDINSDGNCSYDPEPHIDEDPAGDMSADRVDNDFDGLVDLADPDFDGDLNVGFNDDDGDGEADEDGVARGVQEYYTVFQDDIEASFVGNPDNDGHTPLRIEVSQRSYAFPEDYASEFILLDYRIRNFGFVPLENVFVGMFADADIGGPGEGGDAASLDDFNYYDPGRLMMVQYDKLDDNDGTGPGVFAIRVVKTPVALDSLLVSFRNFERVSGGDPETNADKYNMISSGDIDPATPQQGDWRYLIGFGARSTNGFYVPPGGELPITVAFIAGADTESVGRNAEWALRMYLNDFQGPAAPDVPEFEAEIYPFPGNPEPYVDGNGNGQYDAGESYTDMNGNGMYDENNKAVRILWKDNAEASVDPITNEADFEGYIIERSTDQLSWQTIAAYDRIDTLEIPFEWQNYNRGMPTDVLWTVDSSFINDHWVYDSTKYYYFWDRNLVPGHTYYYSVRAYDTGVLGAGILYSGRTGNVLEVLLARTEETTPQTANNLDGVYVFPNPYKGSHGGEEGGQVNPSKGLIEYPRKLYFMGLPANNCVIRIYSLAGDHVATLHHTNGTEQEQWDMITSSRQEIVSGIYYYTVEYSRPPDKGGGTERFIDKFVVIK